MNHPWFQNEDGEQMDLHNLYKKPIPLNDGLPFEPLPYYGTSEQIEKLTGQKEEDIPPPGDIYSMPMEEPANEDLEDLNQIAASEEAQDVDF